MSELKGASAENVLTMLCWNEQYCQEIALRVKPEHFNLRAYREIAEPVIEFINQYGKPPRGHLMDLLENKVRRDDPDSKLLKFTLEEMERIQADVNGEYVMSVLDQFMRKAAILSRAEQAFSLANADQLDKAEETMVQGAFQNADKFKDGIWVHKPEQVLAFLNGREQNDQFSSGVEALDERGIRPAPKTLYLFMGPAKAGKSWHLVQIGVEAMLRGRNVLHVTLENSQEMTGARYVQNICSASSRDVNKIHITSFQRDQDNQIASKLSWESLERFKLLPEMRARIEAKITSMSVKGKALIKEFPTGTLTVAELNGYLDFLQRSENFVPDLLIVDYVDLMYIDARNLRIDTGRVTRELRGICVKRNLAGVTATQTNRESLSARTIGGGHVAEDWSKIGTCDIIISYNQTPRERERGIARLFVVGARGMKDKFLILITQAYEFGQFCLDSVFFSNAVADQLTDYLAEKVDDSDAY